MLYFYQHVEADQNFPTPVLIFQNPQPLLWLRDNGYKQLNLEKPINDISATLAERGGRYGQFIDHAEVAQGVQDVLRAHDNWDKLDVDMKQALSVIADKMARILNGDPFYEDNWHDIQGYAKLVEDRIAREKGA